MRKSTLLFILYLSSFIFLLIAFAFLVPFPLPPYLDFQVLYHADLGFLRGIPVYDHAGQVDMIAHLAGVAPEQVSIPSFPYPPWYALTTVYLALLPIEMAARLWFGINLVMLLASVWLLTAGWTPKARVVSFLVAILFPPVLGSLYVGQFTFPVLLGATLMIFSIRRSDVFLAALSVAFLTFKPHLGGPVVLAALIHLYLRRDDFSRRALKAILVTAIFLFAFGFLADPAWPVNYFRSLIGFGNGPGVSICNLCASLPITLVNLATGKMSLGPALPVGVMILVVLSALLFILRRDLFRAPSGLLPAATLISLLWSPHLFNYDYILLLVPLLVFSASVRRVDWPWLALAYLLPLFLLGLFGRGGSPYLPLAALLLLSYQITRTKSIDVSLCEA